MGRIAEMIARKRDDAPGMSQPVASEVLAWMEHPHTGLFMAWVREQSERPILPSESHMDMVVAAAETNCYKRVLEHLKRVERQARMVLENG